MEQMGHEFKIVTRGGTKGREVDRKEPISETRELLSVHKLITKSKPSINHKDFLIVIKPMPSQCNVRL